MNARQEWRTAIRDSNLDIWAKAVAWTIDTYLDGHGDGWPSRTTIAHGAACSVSAVKRAIHRLEAGGFLIVVRSPGRRTNRYHATLLNGFKSEPVEDSNGSTESLNGFKADPRTRSTELENHARARETAKPEPRPLAGAYRKFADKPPDITVDADRLEQAKAWLSVHRL